MNFIFCKLKKSSKNMEFHFITCSLEKFEFFFFLVADLAKSAARKKFISIIFTRLMKVFDALLTTFIWDLRCLLAPKFASYSLSYFATNIIFILSGLAISDLTSRTNTECFPWVIICLTYFLDLQFSMPKISNTISAIFFGRLS